jgi:CRISPR system Cascade subunit CasE
LQPWTNLHIRCLSAAVLVRPQPSLLDKFLTLRRLRLQCLRWLAIVQASFIFPLSLQRPHGVICRNRFLVAAIGQLIVTPVQTFTSCGPLHQFPLRHKGAIVFLAQVPIDFVAAVRHLKTFLQPTALDDESLILKSILWEGFSGSALRPWAIHAQRGAISIIVGYTQIDAAELNKRRALALPSVQAAVGEAIAVPLPSLATSERYRFSICLAPTVRVTKAEGRRYGERDAFLAKAEIAGKDAGLKRDDVYREYLADRLAGASIEASHLVKFTLRRLMRPKKDRSVSGKTMPEAVIEGRLRVDDPARLTEAIVAGVGRQRAYGFGMLRLQPQ